MFWHIALSINILIVLGLQALSVDRYLPIFNAFVPDSFTYETKALNLAFFSGEPLHSVVYNTFNALVYQASPVLFLVTNVLLLHGSLWLARRVFAGQGVQLPQAFIACNPYLLLAAIGPHKETLLLFLFLLGFQAIRMRGASGALLSALSVMGMLVIRPIFGIVYALARLSSRVKTGRHAPFRFSRRAVLAFLVLNAIPAVNSIFAMFQDKELLSFQGSRILEYAFLFMEMNEHPLLQAPAFFGKAALLLFTPALRPLSVSIDFIPLLDIGYSLLALAMLPLNIVVFADFFLSRERVEDAWTSKIILFVFLYSFVVILNPVITFRYLFPVLPFLAALYERNRSRLKSQLNAFYVPLAALALGANVLLNVADQPDLERFSALIPHFWPF
jgi:hypothetical protein